MEELYKSPYTERELDRKCQEALEGAMTPRKVLKTELENRMKKEKPRDN